MRNSEDLLYSQEALFNKYYFLEDQVDVVIYVEDTNKEYEYEKIFQRLFDMKLKCKIIALDGKLNLEEAFRTKTTRRNKAFYIADGDFDLALGRTQIQADNFVYLKKYNIECYYLYQPAILTYMSMRLGKQIQETASLIDYDNWESNITPYYKKVFALHCIVQKQELGIPNVAKGACYFIDKNGFPNLSNYQRYLTEIKSDIPDINNQIEPQVQELENLYGNDLNCFICGKYIIESLSRYLNSKPVHKKRDSEDLKNHLILSFDTSQLNYIKDKVLAYIGLS